MEIFMFDPIKKLQKGQSKALAVFQKAKDEQVKVLGDIQLETEKVKKKIAEEQAKETQLAGLETSASKFLAKIDDFLGADEAPVAQKVDKE